MSINDDILLLKLIQSGNEQAFKYLFDTYFASLCRFAHVYVSDRLSCNSWGINIC